MDKAYILGFDIGGTKISVCLGDEAGNLYGEKRIVSKNRGPGEVLPELLTAGHDLLKHNSLETGQLRAIGVAVPAPADIPNGIITEPTNNPLWRNVKLGKYLHENFKCDVFFENDANAGALAEWFFGHGKGCGNLVYLTMSTGIGGGIIAEGKLLRGKGLFAGELGHIVLDPAGPQCNCGLRGCYEAFCGGRAIEQRLQQLFKTEQPKSVIPEIVRGDLKHIDMIAVEKALCANDPFINEFWDGVCERHAQALGSIINIFDPELIVMGTFAYTMRGLFLDPIVAKLNKYCWREMLDNCRLLPSKLERSIGPLSAIAVALEKLGPSPCSSSNR